MTVNFLELADYLVATTTLVLGYAAGRRRGPRSIKKNRVQAKCMCGHGFGVHVEGGTCGEQVKRACNWDLDGFPTAWEYIPCSCVRYDGPDPELVRQLLA